MSKPNCWDCSIEYHIQVALYDDGHHKFKPQTKAELFKWLETCCCRKRFWNDNWRERAEIIFKRMIKTGKIYRYGISIAETYKLSAEGVKDMMDDDAEWLKVKEAMKTEE